LGGLLVEYYFSVFRIEEIVGFQLFSLSSSAVDEKLVQYQFFLVLFNLVFDVADLY